MQKILNVKTVNWGKQIFRKNQSEQNKTLSKSNFILLSTIFIWPIVIFRSNFKNNHSIF